MIVVLPQLLLPKQQPSADAAAQRQEGHAGETLRCASCHAQIVQGEHMTVTEQAMAKIGA